MKPAWRAAARTIRERRSVILAYHGVAPATRDEDPHFMRVAPDRFKAQVELLLDAGFDFVTVADLVERAGRAAPAPGSAVLSFDDGLLDNHSVVLPILRSYGVPATVYVTTGLIGKTYPWLGDKADARMMGEDELRDLVRAGFEIGAHTVAHPDLSLLDREECLREMVESRDVIEEITGQGVRTFAYPFCHYGDAAVAAARDAGFIAAVTCQGRGDWSRYELKRALITGKDGLPGFLLKLIDAYEPLFQSRAGRALRGTTRAGRRTARALIER
jgi:peptidoglycan/xylan/chitin deacetylase (PgdA/CDA1 family)